MKTMAEALLKLSNKGAIGQMVQEAQSRTEQEEAERREAVRRRAEKFKAQRKEEHLDDLLQSHEKLMERACREGLPGFAPTSALDLLPGARALCEERACVVKAHLLDTETGEVLVIVRYEKRYPTKYVEGRESDWDMVEKDRLRPWQPKRPGNAA